MFASNAKHCFLTSLLSDNGLTLRGLVFLLTQQSSKTDPLAQQEEALRCWVQGQAVYSHEKHDSHQDASALAEQEERRCRGDQTLISLCDGDGQIQRQS